jgi:hypothetical protein
MMIAMRALATYSAVIARQKREARLHAKYRATQYAAAYPLNHRRLGVLDPRFRGDDDHF